MATKSLEENLEIQYKGGLMKPLEDIVDEIETLKEVQKHLRSFQRVKHKVHTVDERSQRSTSILVPPSSSGGPSRNMILETIERVDEKNNEINNYLQFIIKGLNQLDKYSRKILIYKYFYNLDEEELQEELGCGLRKLRQDIKDAELNLAYKLECLRYKCTTENPLK
jgi:ArpU family phage transcriptional regulator